MWRGENGGDGINDRDGMVGEGERMAGWCKARDGRDSKGGVPLISLKPVSPRKKLLVSTLLQKIN